MIPSRKEMMAYWFEHPIAGTFIAFGVAEAVKTIWESLVNPKGKSPFSSYTDIRSGDVLDSLGTLEEDFAKLQEDHKKAIEHHDKYHYEHHKNIKEEALGHLTRKQKQELEDVTKGLEAASKMHATQASQLTAASKMHAKQAKTIEQLGSTSTTTSTSSAHGGTPKVPTGSTWDKHSGPGDKLEMFGGHKMKGSVLMGPPSMRRRISLNSITLGGMHKAPQKINTEKEELPVSSHFGLLGMMPEQSEDATDNPWV
jgi:hypothetical protein